MGTSNVKNELKVKRQKTKIGNHIHETFMILEFAFQTHHVFSN